MVPSAIELIRSHRSIRRFKPDPVSEEALETMLHAGTRAATAGNLQLYSFLVLDDPEKLAALEELAGAFATPPPLAVMVLVDLHRIRRWLEVKKAADPVLSRPAYLMLGMWDAIAALQNLILAAESLGLGTCYVGAALEMDATERFGAPELVYPAGLVGIGHPDEDPEPRMRLPLEGVVHRNAYRSPDDETIRRVYAERDVVWEGVSEQRKAALAERGIAGIAQALAVQRFSDEATRGRSERILASLKSAGFRFEPEREG